jgi:hypothetical protein
MAFGNPSTQAGDLMQIGLEGSYSEYLEWEGAWLQDSSEGSVNIPWLLGIALALGNAATKALGETANVHIEPEWGWDQASIGRDIGPDRQQMWLGGAVGGWIQSW